MPGLLKNFELLLWSELSSESVRDDEAARATKISISEHWTLQARTLARLHAPPPAPTSFNLCTVWNIQCYGDVVNAMSVL